MNVDGLGPIIANCSTINVSTARVRGVPDAVFSKISALARGYIQTVTSFEFEILRQSEARNTQNLLLLDGAGHNT